MRQTSWADARARLRRRSQPASRVNDPDDKSCVRLSRDGSHSICRIIVRVFNRHEKRQHQWQIDTIGQRIRAFSRRSLKRSSVGRQSFDVKIRLIRVEEMPGLPAPAAITPVLLVECRSDTVDRGTPVDESGDQGTDRFVSVRSATIECGPQLRSRRNGVLAAVENHADRANSGCIVFKLLFVRFANRARYSLVRPAKCANAPMTCPGRISRSQQDPP